MTALARHRGLLTLRAALGAAATSLVALAGAAALAVGLWQLLLVLHPAYAQEGPFLDRPVPYRVATVALAVLAVVAWYVPVRRRVGPVATTAGAVAPLATLGVVAAAVVPGASFLAAWPVLGLVAGLALATAGRPGAAALGAVPAVVLLVPFAVASFGIGGVTTPIPAVAFALVGLPLVAVLDPGTRDRRDVVLPVLALATAVAATATGLLTA